MFCWAIFLKGMSAQLIKVNGHCIFLMGSPGKINVSGGMGNGC